MNKKNIDWILALIQILFIWFYFDKPNTFSKFTITVVEVYSEFKKNSTSAKLDFFKCQLNPYNYSPWHDNHKKFYILACKCPHNLAYFLNKW